MTASKLLPNRLIGFCGLVAVVLIFAIWNIMPEESKLNFNSPSESGVRLAPKSVAFSTFENLNDEKINLNSSAAFEQSPFVQIQENPMLVQCEIATCDPKTMFEERFKKLKIEELNAIADQSPIRSVDDLKQIVQKNSEKLKMKDTFSNDPSVYRNPF